jgi:hypothetical protein
MLILLSSPTLLDKQLNHDILQMKQILKQKKGFEYLDILEPDYENIFTILDISMNCNLL